MAINLEYFTLNKLSEALNRELKGAILMEAFSSSKEELWFHFYREPDNFIIKITFAAGNAFFNFYVEPITNRNKLPVFREIEGATVNAVVQHFRDRSFRINFSDDYSVLFKLYGPHSNVLLFKDNEVIQAFRKQFLNDMNIKLDTFVTDRNMKDAAGEAMKSIPAPGTEGTEQKETAANAKIRKALLYLQNPHFYIHAPRDENDNYRFSLSKENDDDEEYLDVLKALDSFSKLFLGHYFYRKEKKDLLSGLSERLKKVNSLLKNAGLKLEQRKNISYENMAHQIMANLHNLKEGDTQAEFSDFYSGAPMKVKLNPKLSPQLNAAHYYKKGKNEFIETQNLTARIELLQLEAESLEEEIVNIEKTTGFKGLKSFRKQAILKKEKTERQVFREYNIEGFRVLVGKSASDNDELTRHVAQKNDLWLHAKDVSGSHVIIRHQSGKTYPRTVIEKAAAIAAFYSKRKNDSLCPVIYTEKKHVRKPKGAEPGKVRVEREQMIMVIPAVPQTS